MASAPVPVLEGALSPATSCAGEGTGQRHDAEIAAHLIARAETYALLMEQAPTREEIARQVQALQAQQRQLDDALARSSLSVKRDLDRLLLSPWTYDSGALAVGWKARAFPNAGCPSDQPGVTLWLYAGESGPAWGVTAERPGEAPALRRPLGALAALPLEGALAAAEAAAREAGWVPSLRAAELAGALAGLPAEGRAGLTWEEDERAPGAYWVSLAGPARGGGRRARLKPRRHLGSQVLMILSYAHLRDVPPVTFPVYDLAAALRGAAAFLGAEQ